MASPLQLYFAPDFFITSPVLRPTSRKISLVADVVIIRTISPEDDSLNLSKVTKLELFSNLSLILEFGGGIFEPEDDFRIPKKKRYTHLQIIIECVL